MSSQLSLRVRTCLVGLAISLLPACGSDDDSAGATTNFDRQFIDMMVPHHQGAIAMAEVARQRGEHAEIKAMAQDIITAQQTEIGQLKSWRKEWYGSEATPPMNQMPMLPGMDMSMPMPNIDQQVSQLQTANPFDKAFIEDMIPHHEMAMDAAMIAQEKATHDEIQRMADDIIETQQAEIDQMKEWKASWYPAQ